MSIRNSCRTPRESGKPSLDARDYQLARLGRPPAHSEMVPRLLDLESGEAVGDLLLAVAASTGSTLIVASHDQHLIGRLDRRLTLSGGRVVADTERKEIAA